MKIFGCIILALAFTTASAQTTVPVSSTGIGDIKINMSVSQVEKITGQTISLKPTSRENYSMDTIMVIYKGIKLTLAFYEAGGSESNPSQKKVYGIGASDKALQTRSGIGPGSDKFDIVKKLDGLHLTLQPDWRMLENPEKAKYSVLTLSDGENGTQLVMYFESNKLTGFYISIDEGC